MPLEHQREALAHLARRLAYGDGACDIGRTLEILGARVHKIELSGAELAVRGGRYAIMHDGAIGTGARDRIEADVLKRLRLAADLLEPTRGSDLVERAPGRPAVKPGEKPYNGRPIALVRGARTLDLCGVLARLRQQARVCPPHDAGLAALELAKEPARGRSRIEPYALGYRPELPQPILERLLDRDIRPLRSARALGALAIGQDLGKPGQMRAGFSPDLFAVHEQLRLAACRHERIGQGHRVVRHIGAANVEEPGNGIRQGQDNNILTLFAQARLQLGDLLLGRLAGIAQRMHDDRPNGWSGTRGTPDLVDQVRAADGDELDAFGPQFLGQILDHGLGVQPGIETHASTRLQALAEPILELGLGRL